MGELRCRSRNRQDGWAVGTLFAVLRIVLAMLLGLVTGLVLGERALVFEIPSKVILQLLGALAPPLILIAVTHVLMIRRSLDGPRADSRAAAAQYYCGGF